MKVQQEGAKMGMQFEDQQFKQQMALAEEQRKRAESASKIEAQDVENLNTQMDSLKKAKEAIGADAIVGPTNTAAYANQAEIVLDEQNNN